MITKTAQDLLEKHAYLLSALLSAYRSGQLSDSQKEVLKKHYQLSPDSNLVLRNMGRAIAGDTGGTIAGGILGSAMVQAQNPWLKALGLTMPLAGSIGGGILATRKYSPLNPALQSISEEGTEV